MTNQQLKTLCKLLRKQGVQSYKCDGFEITFTDSPLPEPKRRASAVEENDAPEEKDFGDLSYEEQLFYSAIPPVQQTEGEEV